MGDIKLSSVAAEKCFTAECSRTFSKKALNSFLDNRRYKTQKSLPKTLNYTWTHIVATCTLQKNFPCKLLFMPHAVILQCVWLKVMGPYPIEDATDNWHYKFTSKSQKLGPKSDLLAGKLRLIYYDQQSSRELQIPQRKKKIKKLTIWGTVSRNFNVFWRKKNNLFASYQSIFLPSVISQNQSSYSNYIQLLRLTYLFLLFTKISLSIWNVSYCYFTK